MNKKDEMRRVKEIFDEYRRKEDEIMQKAKTEGRWALGLDSNKELFLDIKREAKEKLQALAKKIDRE